MRAGTLKHRIRLQRPFEIIDKGQSKTLWIDIGYFWAAVEDHSSKEITESNSQQGISNHSVTMRFKDLSSNHRFIFRDRVYNLAGTPQQDPKNRQITCLCTCKEGVLPTADVLFQMTGGIQVGGENGIQ